MKKLLLALFTTVALVLLVTASSTSCGTPEAFTWDGTTMFMYGTQPPAHLIIDAVGIVYSTPGEKGRVSITGTAFAIHKDLLLTAGHVCRKLEEKKKEGLVGTIEVGLVGGHGLPTGNVSTKIIKFSSKPDLCLLFSDNHGMSVLPISQRYKSVRSGDLVMMVGAPAGYFPVTRDGRVSSVRAYAHGPSNGESLLLDLPAEGGFSGSPVVWKGEVIGLLVKVLTKPKNASTAVTSLTILQFLEEVSLEGEK